MVAWHTARMTDPGPRRRWLVLGALGAVLVVVLATLFGFLAGRSHVSPPPAVVSTPVSGLPTVALSALPSQARDTLALIDKGGPFPYDRDGIVFANAERLLPSQPRGYYHEYTVATPGSRDRGTRRLIVGAGGDIYYTDDHYASFRQVLR